MLNLHLYEGQPPVALPADGRSIKEHLLAQDSGRLRAVVAW